MSPSRWKRCWTSCHQRALALSLSVIPGSTALATIRSRLRKSLWPFESQGLTTSVAPTFSIRTERFDSQVCSKGCQTPWGERQFRPSIVPVLDDDVLDPSRGDLLHVPLRHVGRVMVRRPRGQSVVCCLPQKQDGPGQQRCAHDFPSHEIGSPRRRARPVWSQWLCQLHQSFPRGRRLTERVGLSDKDSVSRTVTGTAVFRAAWRFRLKVVCTLDGPSNPMVMRPGSRS